MIKNLTIFWKEDAQLVGDRALDAFEDNTQALYDACVQSNADRLCLYVAQTTTLDALRAMICEGKITAEEMLLCVDDIFYEIDKRGRVGEWPPNLNSYDRILYRLLHTRH